MVAFYRDSLGMQVTDTCDESGNRGTLFDFAGKADSTVIEVIELGDEAIPGVKPVNIALSIEVDNANTWHDRLSARGILIARVLEDAPWGRRSFGIVDPDGLRICYYHDMNKNQN